MTNKFGSRIRKARFAMGFTLKGLEKVAHISESYLSLIECGKMKPPADGKIKQLASLLHLEYDDLMYLAGRLPPDVQAAAEKDPETVARLVRAIMPRKKGE